MRVLLDRRHCARVLQLRECPVEIFGPSVDPWGAGGRPLTQKTKLAKISQTKEARPASDARTSSDGAAYSTKKFDDKPPCNSLHSRHFDRRNPRKNPYIWACHGRRGEEKENHPAGKTYLVAYSSKYKLTDNSPPLCASSSLFLFVQTDKPARPAVLKRSLLQMLKKRVYSKKESRGNKREKRVAAVACRLKRKSSKPRPTCSLLHEEGMSRKPQTLNVGSSHQKWLGKVVVARPDLGRNSKKKAVLEERRIKIPSVLAVLTRPTDVAVPQAVKPRSACRPEERSLEAPTATARPTYFTSDIRQLSTPSSAYRAISTARENEPTSLQQLSRKSRRVKWAELNGRTTLFVWLIAVLLGSSTALTTSTNNSYLGLTPRRHCPLMPLKSQEGLEVLAQSIDRSRKRHLEEGLLRGDQARDRLRVQEASASPLLKKTRKSPTTTPPKDTIGPTMAMTMAEFKEYMDSNTNKRLGEIDTKIGGMQSAIKENTAKLNEHDAHISEIRSELVKMKAGPFPPLPAGSGPLGPPVPDNPTLPSIPAPDEEYQKARRSLRLWPISGPDLWNATGNFLVSNLGMNGQIDNDSVEDIAKVQLPSGPGVSDEVLVRFRSAALRDLVMGAASKLATFIDRDGRATAGMRMEVPPKLRQAFRVLFKYGSNLRARHGPGTRRHIKFCDIDHTLYLNVKLPGDESWSRVSLQVALRGMRARETITDGQLERRLDITGPFQEAPRRRAASVNAPPPPTEASAWTRRAGSSTSS